MQATPPRPFSRFALMALAATAVTSCSLPPQQAWRQIQRDGLIPFMVQEWNSGTPASSAPATQQQLLATTKALTPPVQTIASVTPAAQRSAADLIGPPSNATPSPAMIDSAKIPTADAAVGIPGYVRSPYTTPPRLVDVRGMTAGSKVVCPFTHKPFLVPAAAAAPAVAATTPPAPATTAPATSAATKPPVPATPSQVAALTPKTLNTPPPSTTPAPQMPAQTPPAAGGAQEIPQGIPIVGRPGFVNSPFAAKHQLVDVTGLPVGMEVKCPYTGKLFRVPPQAQGQVPVEKTASPQKK